MFFVEQSFPDVSLKSNGTVQEWTDLHGYLTGHAPLHRQGSLNGTNKNSQYGADGGASTRNGGAEDSSTGHTAKSGTHKIFKNSENGEVHRVIEAIVVFVFLFPPSFFQTCFIVIVLFFYDSKTSQTSSFFFLTYIHYIWTSFFTTHYLHYL